MGWGGAPIQHLSLKTFNNSTKVGKLVSCQVLQRYLSCCRSLAYLLGEASCWFHLTCSVLSSALLGFNDCRTSTDSLNHKCLQIPSKPTGWKRHARGCGHFLDLKIGAARPPQVTDREVTGTLSKPGLYFCFLRAPKLNSISQNHTERYF